MAEVCKQLENDSPTEIDNCGCNVLKGDEVVYEIPFNRLGNLVLERLESDEDFVGQIDPVTDEKYSYKKMRDRSVRCALWMIKQGLKPGDVVAICSHNQLDAVMPCFAALYIGAIFNPLDAGMIARDFHHLLKIMKPKMAFANEKSAPIIAEASKKLKLDLKIVVFGEVHGFLKFEDIIDQQISEEVKNFKMENNSSKPDDVAFITCSSGTTGLPKGVALSHTAILKSLSALKIASRLQSATSMIFSSLYWISGTYFAFLSLYARMTNLITPQFDEQSACANIEKYKVNLMMIAPSMISRLLRSDALSGKYDLSSLKVVLYAGSPISNESVKKFAQSIPNALVMTSYGMTECGGSVTRPIPNPKSGSCGPVSDNAQLKVIDPSTGRALGVNETGEFYVKTSSMMSFYYNDPQATADAIDEQGWLRTGDIGYYDEDGEIFIVDRLKELIKYCNYQISPNEIESVILSHPGVKEAVVVGLPHPDDGEHPIAFVVRSPAKSDTEKQVTETDLINLVATELSDTKRLRGGVQFVDSVPKTSSGKVLRKVIRDMAKSL